MCPNDEVSIETRIRSACSSAVRAARSLLRRREKPKMPEPQHHGARAEQGLALRVGQARGRRANAELERQQLVDSLVAARLEGEGADHTLRRAARVQHGAHRERPAVGAALEAVEH